jgi:AmmeMemoRadiSam system protein B
LPLIQTLHNKDFTFVPITLASNDDLVYKKIAAAIAAVIQASKKHITIIASSDMTHYETQSQANKKDEEAIRSILALKPDELLAKVEKLNITMCGAIPTAVAITSAKKLGATKARLVAYQTSGDVTEDFTSVVGYAGVVIQ